MVKIGLQIRAQLQGVTNVKTSGDDFRWYVKLKCSNCQEISQAYQYLTLLENSPLKGGRGHASMVMRCKLCSRENSIDIIRDSLMSYRAEHSGTFSTIVEFDCRGMEPCDFSPRIGFMCEGEESGTNFSDVSLVEKEWCEYDEKTKEEVGIYELEHQFVMVKR